MISLLVSGRMGGPSFWLGRDEFGGGFDFRGVSGDRCMSGDGREFDREPALEVIDTVIDRLCRVVLFALGGVLVGDGLERHAFDEAVLDHGFRTTERVDGEATATRGGFGREGKCHDICF